MSADETASKAALRRELRAVAKDFSPTQRAEASTRICQRLQDQAVWRDAGSVLLYVPQAGEPDVWPLVAEALSLGKTVALPHYSAAEGRYMARRVVAPEREMAPGQFGILEPAPTCPVVELNKLDLLLVPGIGFTLNGRRLGRGKGYYDRLLAEASGIKCGVAFDWQVLIEIPIEAHDILLTCILTPTRWHEVSRQARS